MPVRQKSWGLPVRPPDRTATINPDENELEQQSTEAAVKYWLSEAEKLQPEQRLLFERGAEADSYEDYVSGLTRAVQNTTNSSKVSRLSRKMKPVYALVKSVAPLVASADQASPFPPSLVIGGITCILSASNRVDDYQSKLIENMEGMVDEIDSINQYRREGIFQDDPGIKACELNLATDIFQFCVRVVPIFYDEKGKERNGLSVAMKVQFKDFDTKFGDIMAHFKQHLRALENRRGLINNRWTKETHLGVKEMGLLMEQDSQDKKEAMEEKLRQHRQAEDNERAQRRKEFLDWLPSIDFGEFHDNAFERSVDGTGDWLTQNNDYKAWNDNSSSSMLWIRGKHGSGKSHLASRIIEKLLLEAKTAPGNAVAFVYCTTTQSKTEMTLNNLLGSLMRQICRQLPPSRDVKDLISKDDYSSKESPRRSDLKSGILKAISACRASSIIVDGLDECSKLNDSHFKEFCNFIASLVESSGTVTKVIVLSRANYGEIDKIMENVSYIIDVDTGANHADIQKFVSQTVSEINPEPSQEELDDFEEIKSKLVNNAAGMFLYVRLKVRDFGDLGNAEDIRASLEDTVEDLNDLYGHAINSILEKRSPFRERALMALLWITNSRRPLSKMELLEALSLKLKRNSIKSSQRLKSDYQICRQCADLITETGGFYYLIHGSLEDYLLSNSVGLSEYRALQSQAHDIIAEACLSYLNFDDFQKNRARAPSELFQLQQQYPLLHYASSQWGGHYKQASLLGDRGSEIKKLSLELLSVDSLVHLCLKVINLHELAPEDLTPVEAYFDRKPTAVHLICALDLRSLVESIPRCVDLIDHFDHIGWAPIQYALHFNSKDMCIWILDTIQERQDKQALIDELVGDRYCLLHYVVDRNWDDVLRHLLSFNCDPDVRDNYGETPLHCAIQSGCQRSFEMLLAAGADITIESNDGTTPLIEAVDSGELKFVKEILDKITDVTRSPTIASALNRQTQPDNIQRLELINHSRHNGENAFLLGCALGPGSVVKMLLEHGADIKALNAERKGETGLHVACTHGQCDVIDILLSRHEAIEMINARDFEGYTPLHNTVYRRDLAVASKLLQHGAQPDLFNVNLFTPLAASILSGAYDFAEALIVDYRVDALSGADNNTALHWAARVGWSRILQIIPNMSIWSQTQHKKHTPLHAAAGRSQIEFMAEFIKLPFAPEIFPLDKFGGTPLHTAAAAGALGVVELLLKTEPSSLLLKDEGQNLPLHISARNGHLACTRLLTAADIINERDKYGCTPLWHACRGGHEDIVEYLMGQNADIDLCDIEGCSPVGIAIIHEQERIATSLLARGAECQSRGPNGDTPLHNAAVKGSQASITHLIKAGCNPLIQDDEGATPLMRSIFGGWPEAVALLLSAAPKAAQIRDRQGQSCMHIATHLQSPQILEMLLVEDYGHHQSIDNMGFDAMCHAAERGAAVMIDILSKFGVPLSGVAGSSYSPLWLAAANRCSHFLRELLNREIDLEEDLRRCCGPRGADALNIAAKNGNMEATYVLLQLGADPTTTNRLGLSAIDYACNFNFLQSLFTAWLPTSRSLPSKPRLQALRTAIIEDCNRFTSMDVKDLTNPNTWGLWIILQDELALLNSRTSRQQLQLLVAIHFQAAPDLLDCFYRCDWRPNKVSGNPYFLHFGKSSCHMLCDQCHQDYMGCVERGQTPLLKFFFNELERSTMPVLEVIQVSWNKQPDTLWMCLNSLEFIADWLEAITDAYPKCVKESRFSAQFYPFTLPGWSLTEVLKRVQVSELFRYRTRGDSKAELRKRRVFNSKLKQDFSHLIPLESPYSETPHVYQPGDSYIGINETSASPPETQNYFDEQGQLGNTIFKEISDHYAGLGLSTMDEISDMDSGPLPSNKAKSPAVSSSQEFESDVPFEAEFGIMRRVLGHDITKFLAIFIPSGQRESILCDSAEELLTKLSFVYLERQRLREESAEFKKTSNQIEAYELSWRLLHAILNIEYTQPVRDFWHERVSRENAELNFDHNSMHIFRIMLASSRLHSL
ncbi:hypothetical protein CNYM01_11926 [Colletotrichum nymphaeae SA-01]|uniref:Nephrocystin 3-like N-terminal domain-containing protein n=1 Tax=Colletotrichum nymphaeae SA-01 TaxID=1460502 RepID=A0A135RSQ2_9PEZI|nr:hypothetical protein CNYM01_11926 [Colletotrichum nymphaeae SA-01]